MVPRLLRALALLVLLPFAPMAEAAQASVAGVINRATEDVMIVCVRREDRPEVGTMEECAAQASVGVGPSGPYAYICSGKYCVRVRDIEFRDLDSPPYPHLP